MPERQRDIDKILAGLAGKVPPPLTGWHFTSAMRQQVQKRISLLRPISVNDGKKYDWRRQRPLLLVGTVAFVMVLMLMLLWPRSVSVHETPVAFKVTPLQYHYMVSLNGNEPDALISIGQIETFNQFLVSISKRRMTGWRLIYTQPLDAYLILPVRIIPADNSKNTLILITYQSQWGPEYRYLILEFDGDKVIPYQR